ncbi:hypothetical protein [Streptomyces sp. TP-A0874]|uniref:hypothetical protein n=1 Tax=Streptomyces sp. TP-A0874 TaxID=549819 RepID=UPI0008538AFA|nr:hypothetical protein [Streptomyces sp. TP-A0874]
MSGERFEQYGAVRRRREERSLRLFPGVILVGLLGWFVFGFFRRPPAGTHERLFVCAAAALTAAILAFLWFLSARVLPALDRTPRRAVVTGWSVIEGKDEDFVDEPYTLVRVSLVEDGSTHASHLADIIAPQSTDRFTIGSQWYVHAFTGSQTWTSDPLRSRVILAREHEDVIRTGYCLSSEKAMHVPGPGSDLLLRRFENDR